MLDIRKPVLKFAQTAEGTRVWARVHQIGKHESKTKLLPLEQTYQLKDGTDIVCKETVKSWRNDNTTLLSDKLTTNDLSAKDELIRKGCNIGYGECWDLAYAALQANVGLTRVSSYGGTERKWSDKALNDLTNVTGGEILEIKPQTYFLKLLSGPDYQYEANSIGPDIPHTAIIKGVNTGRGSVGVYEQNTVQDGKRNLLVHTGSYGLMNKEYKQGKYNVLQVCGGNAVKNLTTKAEKVFQKEGEAFEEAWSSVVRKVKAYINSNSKLYENIKIYVPQSELFILIYAPLLHPAP